MEIGGTVGDIESLPFLEAIRQLGNELGPERAMFVHLTLVPFIPSAGELKTKPTQHSVKELLNVGIQPQMLLCRCDRPIPENERRKIALFCNVRPRSVIAALDVDTIYAVPISYHAEGMDREVLRHFDLPADDELDLSRWAGIVEAVRAPEGEVRIAVVGKYTNLLDSYKSLAEALAHGGIANRVKVQLDWVDSQIFEHDSAVHRLEECHGILVPGGFGERGTPARSRLCDSRARRACRPRNARTVEAPVDGGARRMPEIVRDLDAAGVLLDDLGDPAPVPRRRVPDPDRPYRPRPMAPSRSVTDMTAISLSQA